MDNLGLKHAQVLSFCFFDATTRRNNDFKHRQTVLDEDHYGLKDIKERIQEFIAVGALRGTVQVSFHYWFFCFGFCLLFLSNVERRKVMIWFRNC